MMGTISLRAGTMDCWACGCETTIITGVDLSFGSDLWQLRVADFDRFPDLFATLRSRIPSALEVGKIKRRFSRTQGRSYLSNGCFHCDALIGEFYEHHFWDNQKTIGEFPAPADERWRQVVATATGEEPDEALI